LETGRALVDEAGTLIATVLANKRLPDGRRAVVLDAGLSILFTSFWYQHEIVPCTEPHGTPEPTVIYGPLCMNIDVVRESIMLPPLEVGSRVLIRPVGAYNVTQSMQFIKLRPAVSLIAPSGQHAQIRRAETLDDLVDPESVPDWLA
jgi:diaminopimelate decarboxylase